VTPWEIVESWADQAKRPPLRPESPPANAGSFDLEAFIARHLTVRRGPFDWPGRGRRWELERCPFNPEHTGGCAVITEGHDGTIGFKCHHHSCADRHWRDVRELFEPRASRRTARQAQAAEPAKPDALLALGLHDAGNADRIVALYGDRLRYCHPMRRWLVWDGKRWAPDERGEAMLLAKQAMAATLEAAVAARNEAAEKWAIRSLDARRLDGALRLAQPELAVSPDELDTDPDLLSLDNGILHLPSGQLTPHDPARFITKLAPVRFDPHAECPRFLDFLERILGFDDSAAADNVRAIRLMHYLQVALGYSLTGWTREKAVFIPYGEKNAGKSTLLATIRELLGDYSAQISVESLMAAGPKTDPNTQADLADLRGARFVVTSEAERGHVLSQSRLKRITQGIGRIKTVRKYENPIEFRETHKLWMDTNGWPRLQDPDDEALLFRLHPIPFLITIPPEEQDKRLPEKLLAEASGILAWLAAGAVEWYRHGLDRPPEVTQAREEWRTEDDQVARFLEDCCVIGDGLEVGAGALYDAYKQWAEAGGEKSIMSSHYLRLRLEGKGIRYDRTKSRRFYAGVDLVSAMTVTGDRR
jgi:putative DNA primase/helicase